MALKDLELRTLKPTDRAFRRTDGGGLYLEVFPNGSKLWRWKFSFLGKEKRLALGRYPEVSLAEARRRRDNAKRQLEDGIDPLAQRKTDKLLAIYQAANTFGDIAKEYIDKAVLEGRALTTTTKANWLLEQLAPISRRPIAELKPMEVLAALKRIEARGKYETARRCRSFAGRVFRFAVATGRAETDPTSVLRGALITPKTKHHGAILEPIAVGELLRSIDGYTGNAVTRLALQIAPHVMARPGELRQATWEEIDLTAATWKVPAARMKMRRPHVVPLSRQVVALLQALLPLTGPDGFAFPAFHTSKRPMCENTINQAFRRLGYRLKVQRWELLNYYGAQDAWRDEMEKDYVSPGRPGAVVTAGNSGRELHGMRWGFPPPQGVKAPVVNVRNYSSPFWRSAFANPARRCLVPVTSFQEWSIEPDPVTGKKRPYWFSVPSRPIFTFAGVWRPTETGPAFAFLTCGYDGDAEAHVVGAIHPKAIPVILHDEDYDRWLTAPVEEALPLACAYPSQLIAVE